MLSGGSAEDRGTSGAQGVHVPVFFPHGLPPQQELGLGRKIKNKQGLLVLLLTQKQEEARGAGVLLLQEIGRLTLPCSTVKSR